MAELPTNWKIQPLQDLTKPDRPISYGVVQTGDPVENGVPCVRVVDLTRGNFDPRQMITTSYKISNSYKRTILRENDLMVALRGEIGFAAKVPSQLFGANLTRGVALISPDESLTDPEFLLQALRSDFVRQDILDRVNGSALKEIPIGNLRQVRIPLPPLPEQRKIAAILSTWDEAITLVDKLIAALKRRKQALMQLLLTGAVRFPGFDGEWEETSLDTIFERVQRGVQAETNVLSITATIGFVEQSKKFGRVIAGKNLDRYILLYRGEFAYNKGNSNSYPQGCIYRLEEFDEGAVPNVYYCFRVASDKAVGDFYKHYFASGALNEELRPLINSGVRNDGLLNLSADGFFNVRIVIPPQNEQKRIAAFLDDASSEIYEFVRLKDLLNTQKRALMQQLLTGAIRVQGEA